MAHAYLLDVDAEYLPGHERALAEGDGVGEAGLAVRCRVVVTEDDVGAVMTVEVVGPRQQRLVGPRSGAQARKRCGARARARAARQRCR